MELSCTWSVLLGMVLIAACGSPGGSSAGRDSGTPPDPNRPDARPDDPPPPPVDCEAGLGAWTGNDNVPASSDPPCGLTPSEVPQFVSIGWDDCGQAEGVNWSLDMYQALGAKGSYYISSTYALTDVYKRIYADGHEIGNHTVSHATSYSVDEARWQQEITDCNAYLTGTVGVPAEEIMGFRTPFLQYNNATLKVVQNNGFRYDTSIEEGYEWEPYVMDGTNFYWPYTLDNRSPGHTVQLDWNTEMQEIDPHPGLWEMPVYAVIVPPDSELANFEGVEPGFRARMKEVQPWFEVESGMITGFDYNLWNQFKMTKAEVVATLEYTLDLRLRGNRAPLLFGAHPDYYVASWDANAPNATTAERREAIEEFLAYAASKPAVRIARYRDVLDWVRNPE